MAGLGFRMAALSFRNNVSCSDFTFTDRFSRFAFTFHLHVSSSHSRFKLTFQDSCLDSCIRDFLILALILRRRSVREWQPSSIAFPKILFYTIFYSTVLAVACPCSHVLLACGMEGGAQLVPASLNAKRIANVWNDAPEGELET